MEHGLLEQNRDFSAESGRKCCGKKRNAVLIAAGCIVLIAAVVTALVVVLRNGRVDPDDGAADLRYGVVFDAGSSGTRAHVYAWPRNAEGLPEVVPVENAHGRIVLANNGLATGMKAVAASDKISPGISEVDPENVSEYLAPLFEFVAEKVPAGNRSGTPLFLFATAGMRLLPVEQQTEILKAVKNAIGNTDFMFGDAKVISGAEEGVFGWVSVNYLQRENAQRLTNSGTMDMGGASLEITFGPFSELEADNFTLVLDNTDYNLYTHSFLGYGVNSAFESIIENAKTDSETVIQMPCYHKGYTKNFASADGQVYAIEGTGNATECKELAKTFLNVDAPCEYESCSINGTYQPKADGFKFYALSSFFYAAQFYGLPLEQAIPPSALMTGATEFCSLDWEKAYELYHDSVGEYLDVYCFYGAYMYSTLVDAFHFASDEATLIFADEIDGVSLDWAFGAMIVQAQ